MKFFILFFILLSLLLNAKTYTLSGGKSSVSQMIAYRILEKAYARAGLNIHVRFLKFEESLQYSNEGKTDGELSRIKQISKYYPNLVIVPVAISSINATAYSLNKNIFINKWSDLNKYKITIVKGIKFIEKATKNINKNIVSSYEEAFSNLLNHKSDIIVIPRLAALKIIYNNKYENIKTVSNPLQSLKLYHFVNKKNADLIPILTPILQTMKNSGEIDYWYSSYLKSLM